MQLTPELIGLAATILAHWAHSVRRSSRVETKVDRLDGKVDAIDQELGRQGERVARIEGRLNGTPPG